MVTHDAHVAGFCGRQIRMTDGRVVDGEGEG
jgi:predicted ABC-type transport system involved in lysophospholipase L1 biosynthesis ATPase subunit